MGGLFPVMEEPIWQGGAPISYGTAGGSSCGESSLSEEPGFSVEWERLASLLETQSGRPRPAWSLNRVRRGAGADRVGGWLAAGWCAVGDRFGGGWRRRI